MTEREIVSEKFLELRDATSRSLREQLADVRARLDEAEETLAALRDGDVDAIVINEKLFVLEGADTASNQFRGNVLARVSDAVIAIDSDHRITYVNAAAERQFDMSAPHVLGRTLESVLGVQAWLDPDSPAQGALLDCGTWRGELERTRSDHEHVVEELSLTALFDASGNAEGCLAIVRDITERKKTQAERERLLEAERLARADAEAANHAKSDFLAVMSHELRTPLNAIYGYAQLIEMGIRGPVTQEQHDDLLRIQRSQRHLLGLIEGVLTYAKLDAGAMEYHIARVPVQEVVATCEALVLPQMLEKKIAFEVVSCDGNLAAHADYEKTKQVIINLLSNAIKFTDEGGTITVACAPLNRLGVQIEVTDTGRGISADQLEAVFQPFVQLGINSTLTRTATGTGLGLSISRELALGMGGSLKARSESGVGSTFTLILPAFH